MKGWPTKILGNVLEVSRERIEPTDHSDTCFNYVGLESIEGHTGALLQYAPTLGADIKSTKNVFHAGQILYGKLRPYLNKVHLAETDGICSTDIFVLQAQQDNILPSFAAYYLRSPSVLTKVSNLMAGANLPRISTESLLGIELSLPPLSQQQRVVNFLEEADDLRKLRAQADRRTANLIPALFHQMFGDPVRNDRGWPYVTIAEIAAKEKYSIVDGPFGSSLKQEDYSDTGVPVIRIKNISSEGEFLDRELLYITEEKYRELIRSSVRKGDILVSRVGTLGNTCIYPGTYDKALLSTTGVCKIALDEQRVNRIFLHRLMLMESFQQQIKSSASSAVQSYFNLTALKGWKLILPPLILQRQFAARVAEIRTLEADQAASRRRLDDLFQSMLHRAFNGEL
jgi:type I restriction enzyme, S subunit